MNTIPGLPPQGQDGDYRGSTSDLVLHIKILIEAQPSGMKQDEFRRQRVAVDATVGDREVLASAGEVNNKQRHRGGCGPEYERKGGLEAWRWYAGK